MYSLWTAPSSSNSCTINIFWRVLQSRTYPIHAALNAYILEKLETCSITCLCAWRGLGSDSTRWTNQNFHNTPPVVMEFRREEGNQTGKLDSELWIPLAASIQLTCALTSFTKCRCSTATRMHQFRAENTHVRDPRRCCLPNTHGTVCFSYKSNETETSNVNLETVGWKQTVPGNNCFDRQGTGLQNGW